MIYGVKRYLKRLLSKFIIFYGFTISQMENCRATLPSLHSLLFMLDERQ